MSISYCSSDVCSSDLSTADQKRSLKLDALNAAGCDRIFDDHASGAKAERPGLAEALAYLRSGDTLVVWNLDRLGRSLSPLIEKVGELTTRGIGFRSLTENIATTTPGGRLRSEERTSTHKSLTTK